MDTRTGQIVNLAESEAEIAQQQWLAWKAGLLDEMPRWAPIKNDSIPVEPNPQRRKRKKRSYKDFCNG
jgi:hypothetical protein